MSRLDTGYIAQFIAYCSDVYGIKLYWWQRIALKIMWRYKRARRWSSDGFGCIERIDNSITH